MTGMASLITLIPQPFLSDKDGAPMRWTSFAPAGAKKSRLAFHGLHPGYAGTLPVAISHDPFGVEEAIIAGPAY